MKLSMDALNGLIKKTGFKFKEARPEIALGLGILSIAAGTVWACVKTKDALAAAQAMRLDIDEEKKLEEEHNDGNIDIRERAELYAHYVFEFIKIYGLPALLWLIGIGCVIDSHGEMRDRNGKLLADSIALKKLFDEYRERVKKAVGEEVEQRLYFGAEEEVEVVEELDEETGKKKKKKVRKNVFNSEPGSMYARNFTENTSDEFDIRSYADTFLEIKIKNLNNRLRIVPFITLNDVYDELGFKPGYGRCEDGMTVGWVWNPKIDRGDRKIIITRMEGYEKHWDPEMQRDIFVPCMRLDFNCYPLEGLI